VSEFDDTSDMTEEECRQMLRIVGDERDALREERDEARAELAEARRDVEHLYELVERQSDLLRGVVDALRGPPPPDTAWSVHDAPELAVAAKAELAEARRERRKLGRTKRNGAREGTKSAR
jgi:hypothetical protein